MNLEKNISIFKMGAATSIYYTTLTLPITIPLGMYLSTRVKFLNAAAPFILLAAAIVIWYIEHYNSNYTKINKLPYPSEKFVNIEIATSIIVALMITILIVSRIHRK